MRNSKFFGFILAAMSGMLLFMSCQQYDTAAPIEERNTISSSSMTFYGLGPTNELFTYRSGPPATLISETKITGMSSGEQMLAIDFRPSTKQLFGVSNMDLIYRISVSGDQAIATKVSSDPLSPGISGSTLGFDFNPMTDKISLITDTGQNLRIDPNTGQVIGIDPGVKGKVNGSGFMGQTVYNVDIAEGRLMKTNTATGESAVVGSMDLVIRGEGGFDISTKGQAMGVMLSTIVEGFNSPYVPQGTTRDEAFRLYVISLTSGQVSDQGKVEPMIGMAILE